MVGIVRPLGRGASRGPQQTDPSAPSQVPYLTVLKAASTPSRIETHPNYEVAVPKAEEPPDAIVERSRSEQTMIGADGRPITCIKEKVRLWLGRKWQDALFWLLVGTVASFVLFKGKEILHALKTIWIAARALVQDGQLPF